MPKHILSLLFLFSSICSLVAQSTDLAISVQAQDLSGSDISQVQLYEEFQYLVTISNSGSSVSNAQFSQSINSNAIILSYVSLNPLGGATLITDFNEAGNSIAGTINMLPAGASIQVKIILRAPDIIGGIATNVTINPPNGTTDINNANNTSIISIDVVDVLIDFTVTHSQISPPEGVSISAWNDAVTYQFTITNNSSISYPLSAFSTYLSLNTPQSYGEPIVQLLSIICINSSNGTDCPDPINISVTPVVINSNDTIRIYNYDSFIEFTSGGSLTFEMVYQYLDPACALVMEPIDVTSYVDISLNHTNESSNESNRVITNLIEAELCQDTDVCLETIQIDPIVGITVDWNEEITFETTICNNGPLEADVLVSFRNISDNVLWQILSIECIEASSTMPCDGITFANAGQYWVSNLFNMPVGEFLTIKTVVVFIEPECAIGDLNVQGLIRSNVSIESVDIFDSFLNNNSEVDIVDLPQAPECESVDLSITKTQISPTLPEGGSSENTTSWGTITYEVIASNLGDQDVVIELMDFMEFGASSGNGILESVSCISASGTAMCMPILHSNIGVELDGIPDIDANPDVFWEIKVEDNWVLPATSSITFQVEITWLPNCSVSAIKVRNSVLIDTGPEHVDIEATNNNAIVDSYFAPCIDLVVQTFPEFPSVIVNESFNWIVDITNSQFSSNATNVQFLDELDIPFTITGQPSCEITSGNADCVVTFNITENNISGIIPSMDSGSTVRILIPVSAPNFGGAFVNTAEAIPSIVNNEELTPETNISISSVQVVAPTLSKIFVPDEIRVGVESILTFTINNLTSNPSQSNISFIDNLPIGIFISGDPFWEEANGCTATFIGTIGASTFEVADLTFPEGVGTCSFSVPVTSNIAGLYHNTNSNFSDQINIDTSQANALLNVLEDTTNVDIEINKAVVPSIASIGDEVTFTISVINLGSTNATDIEIYEALPNGYSYVSSLSTIGQYDLDDFLWRIEMLGPNQQETLTIIAQIISSNNLENVAVLENVNETDRDNLNNFDSAEVSVDNCLKIAQSFSPNNDGINDFLIIPCVEDYPNSELLIYNRYGTRVFESTNYLNSWDGKPNVGMLHQKNKLLPVGTYYYIFKNAIIPEPIIGWVYLNY